MPLQFFLSSAEQAEDPFDEEYYDEAADDGLGYYSDGEKRTLTDTQISIFRHSEIQRILWREAGEYAGPIFQPVSKPKGKGKANRTGEQSKKHALGASGRPNKRPGAIKERSSETIENVASSTAEPKAVREASTISTGSNYTPSTASKKKSKKNRKQKTRVAARAFATDVEREAERARAINAKQRRANSSSPEPDGPLAKKAKISASIESAVEERNNPDDFKADGEDYTFRRLARDEDDVKDVALDLDY